MTPTPPTLAELMARFLQSRMAPAPAVPPALLDDGPEVVPHDASLVQAADPVLAWREAVRALDSLSERRSAALAAPPEWSLLVPTVPSYAGVPLAAGNFPQLVRTLPSFPGAAVAPPPSWSEGRAWRSDLAAWAESAARAGLPARLLAAGVVRLAGLHDAAARLLAGAPSGAADRAADRAALANEEAALRWHAGRLEEAARLWRTLPATPAVLFNRGLAALVLDRPAEALDPLRQTLASLPEDSGWHHLACLYLAAAETHPARP